MAIQKLEKGQYFLASKMRENWPKNSFCFPLAKYHYCVIKNLDFSFAKTCPKKISQIFVQMSKNGSKK